MSLFRATLLVLLVGIFLSPPVLANEDVDYASCPHIKVLLTKLPGYWRRDDLAHQELYRRAFAAQLEREGWMVVNYNGNMKQAPTWYLYSQVLPLADGTFVWTWEFKKQPTVKDGLLHFTRFKNLERAETDKFFAGIRGLLQLTDYNYNESATEAAEQVAGIFLAHAHELCANHQASELADMEELRKRLVLEIERVRARERRKGRRKTLELEVEE